MNFCHGYRVNHLWKLLEIFVYIGLAIIAVSFDGLKNKAVTATELQSKPNKCKTQVRDTLIEQSQEVRKCMKNVLINLPEYKPATSILITQILTSEPLLSQLFTSPSLIKNKNFSLIVKVYNFIDLLLEILKHSCVLEVLKNVCIVIMITNSQI